MKEWIEKYLKEQELVWSSATLRSEAYRLRALASAINGDPAKLWRVLLKRQSGYTRTTSWVRVTAFWDWMILEKHILEPANPYKAWRRKNGQLFKHTYKPKVSNLSFDEIKARVSSIRNHAIRSKALELLGSGMRYSESFTYADGEVVGKGKKRRAVFLPFDRGESYTLTYGHFWRVLGQVGVKPHDLRKAFLNEAVRLGTDPFELQALAGWSSVDTAASYIKANTERLGDIAYEIQERMNHDE